MTIQEQIKANLKKSGLPYKEIECYGSQIMITAWSEDAARKWASLLAKFATVRGVVHSVDYNKDGGKAYREAHPDEMRFVIRHDVWRVGAYI